MATSFFINSTNSSDNSKSIPIHCVVESLRTDYDVSTTKSMTSVVERDTYVIVPGHAPFADLVRLTLIRIGYSLVDVLAARGYVELKNWKRLPVDVITDNVCATIEEVLGDLVPMATVCIRLSNSNHADSMVREVQDKMLSFLFACCPSVFACAGCPINDKQLADIVRGDFASDLTENQLLAFLNWHSAVASTSPTDESSRHGRFDSTLYSVLDKASPPTSPHISGNKSPTCLAVPRGRPRSADERHEPRRWFLHGRQSDSVRTEGSSAADHAAIMSRGCNTNVHWAGDGDAEEPYAARRVDRSRSISRSNSVGSGVSGRSDNSDDRSFNDDQKDEYEVMKMHQTKRDVSRKSQIGDDQVISGDDEGIEKQDTKEDIWRLESRVRGATSRNRLTTTSKMKRLYSYRHVHPHPHPHHHHHQQHHRRLHIQQQQQHRQQTHHNNNNNNNNNNNSISSGSNNNNNNNNNGNSSYCDRKSTRQCVNADKSITANDVTGTEVPSGTDKNSSKDTMTDGRRSRDCTTSYDDVIDVASAGSDDRLQRPQQSPYSRFSRLADVGSTSLRRTSTPSPISSIIVGRHNQPETDLDSSMTSLAAYRQSSLSSLPPRSLVNQSPSSTALYRAPSGTSPADCPPPPLPTDLVRQLREQQALRLAAVSRALQHQLRYLHHGNAGGTAGGGAITQGPTATNAAAVAAAAFYYRHQHQPSHQQQPTFDPSAGLTGFSSSMTGGSNAARMQLSQAVASSTALHGLIDPGSGAGLNPCDPLHQLPIPHHHHNHHHQQQQHRSMAAAAGFIADLQALHAATTGRAMSPTDSDNSLENASGVNGLDRRKRSRVFIDPLTEIPRLERWFADDTHPSAYTIEQYTAELNSAPYRQRFPPLEPKNVQLWFKNHRAKVKRQKLEQSAIGSSGSTSNGGPSSVVSGTAEHTDLRLVDSSCWKAPAHSAAETG